MAEALGPANPRRRGPVVAPTMTGVHNSAIINALNLIGFDATGIPTTGRQSTTFQRRVLDAIREKFHWTDKKALRVWDKAVGVAQSTLDEKWDPNAKNPIHNLVDALKRRGITDEDVRSILKRASEIHRVQAGKVMAPTYSAAGGSLKHITTGPLSVNDVMLATQDLASPFVMESLRQFSGLDVLPSPVPLAPPTQKLAGAIPGAPPPTPAPAAPVPAPGAPGAVTPAPALPDREGRVGLTRAAPGPVAPRAATPTTGTEFAVDRVPKTDAEVEQIMHEKFGFLASFLSIPDVANVLKKAVRDGLSDGNALALLYATDFWTKTDDAQKTWRALEIEKPGEAEDQIKNKAAELQNSARAWGFELTEERAREIARTAKLQGWTNAEISKAMSADYVYHTGQSPVVGIASNLKKTAGDYLMPLSDETINQWGQNLIAGTQTYDEFTDYARKQAIAFYPGLEGYLNRDPGNTVKKFVDPYAQAAARELEISPDTVDFLDPKYNTLFGKLDPKTGEKTIMTGGEWQSYLRSLPEWSKTKNANQIAARLGQKLLETFGKVA